MIYVDIFLITFIEDFKWEYQGNETGLCSIFPDDDLECGDGIKHIKPSICRYIVDDSIHDGEACGIQPIVVKNCHKPCDGNVLFVL